MNDEWRAARDELARAGVAGADEFGRFVNNTSLYRPSEFDEKGAMPTLLALLPRTSDASVVGAIAGHLGRSWARPTAFPALLVAFREWAPRDQVGAGWSLGDALGATATLETVDALIEVCLDEANGRSRQMAVYSLGRFKKSPLVEPALLGLLHDDDVALHAMSALRRVLGPAAALPHIETLAHGRSTPEVLKQAERQARHIRKILSAGSTSNAPPRG